MWISALRRLIRAQPSSNAIPRSQGIHKSSEKCVQKSPINLGLYNKVKDSFLIIEAKQGPVGKAAVGVALGVVSGSLVFVSGAVTYYIYHVLSSDGNSFDDTNESFISGELPLRWTFGAGNVPEYVQDRIHTCYMYMTNSLGVSALGALVSFRLFTNQIVLNAVAMNPMFYFGITMASQFLLTMAVRYGS
jgi:hypothetical protein